MQRSATDPPPAPVAADLPDSADLWTAVCRTSGEYLAVIDPSGKLRFCNRIDGGFGEDEVIGRGMTEFTTAETATRLSEAISEVLRTGLVSRVETTVRLADGRLDFFTVQLGPIERAGRVVAVLACCSSLGTLKASEEALRHERATLQRLLEIQERERQMVAYEIHDGLAQYLAGALMHLQAAVAEAPDMESTSGLREALRLLKVAASEARSLIGGLRPPVLDDLGIVEAIESLITETRAVVPSVSFEHSVTCGRLPPAMETAVFRIVQECLSNVRKHAKATTVRVAVACESRSLRVEVQDDGVGFDPAQVAENHFGLEGIRQRARLFGAEPHIASGPGRGTLVTVTFPLAGSGRDSTA
jgi:PAS domain S-box-containing protein